MNESFNEMTGRLVRLQAQLAYLLLGIQDERPRALGKLDVSEHDRIKLFEYLAEIRATLAALERLTDEAVTYEEGVVERGLES